MISDRDHHNNTEPSVVADHKAMNRDEPYEARGRQFPEAVDIQAPGEEGEYAARPEKRQKVGGLDVPTAAQDDDLKKPAAVEATVDKASDDATAMLLTNQSLTATGAMPASAFAGTVAGISDPSIGTAAPKPLQQAMNPPPGFLPPQHQSQVRSQNDGIELPCQILFFASHRCVLLLVATHFCTEPTSPSDSTDSGSE